jgi:hypothetical protein
MVENSQTSLFCSLQFDWFNFSTIFYVYISLFCILSVAVNINSTTKHTIYTKTVLLQTFIIYMFRCKCRIQYCQLVIQTEANTPSTPQHMFVPVPSIDLNFQHHISWSCSVVGLKWEVFTRFVDIGGIFYYHALFKLYFHHTNKKRHA